MMEAVAICAIVALVLICIIMAVVIYNQMLLLNQVNKRLLLMTKESIEKERLTMEELQERLDEFESDIPTIPTRSEALDEDEPFDPHTFDPSDLE